MTDEKMHEMHEEEKRILIKEITTLRAYFSNYIHKIAKSGYADPEKLIKGERMFSDSIAVIKDSIKMGDSK